MPGRWHRARPVDGGAHELLADFVLPHLLLEPEQLVQLPGEAALRCDAGASTRAIRASPGTYRRPSSVIT